MLKQNLNRYFLSTNLPSQEFDCVFSGYAAPILESGKLSRTSGYIQHGTTSCYSHSISVAYYSLRLAESLGISCDFGSLVIGALLHDYYLYDWHDKDSSHRLHGFKHPKTALNNAMQDFDLNPVEQDIIMRHMFPLTPIPPKYLESLIVCLTDKFCSLAETMHIDVLPSLGSTDIRQSDESDNA
jgi:uncharacterized protein